MEDGSNYWFSLCSMLHALGLKGEEERKGKKRREGRKDEGRGKMEDGSKDAELKTREEGSN